MKLAFLLQFISRCKTFTSHVILAAPLNVVTSTSVNKNSLFTDVCVTLVAYRHVVKRRSAASWLLQDLR